MKKLLFGAITAVFALGFAILAINAPYVYAAQPTIDLGTAAPFAVLAGAGITNVPTSTIAGNVGLSPATGANYSGLTQAEVTGTIYSVDAFGPGGYVQNPGLLTTAKNDLTTAYVDASGRTPVTTLAGSDNQLGGKTLTPGVYTFSHADTYNLTAASPLTLSGNGIFIFQATSDLITASASSVVLADGAQACNVFWTVPSSAASFGTNSSFVGTVMAYSSINMGTGAKLEGRILAQTAAVTLQSNTITAPTTCLATTYVDVVTPRLPNTGTTSNGSILAIVAIVGAFLIAIASFIVIRTKRAN